MAASSQARAQMDLEWNILLPASTKLLFPESYFFISSYRGVLEGVPLFTLACDRRSFCPEAPERREAQRSLQGEGPHSSKWSEMRKYSRGKMAARWGKQRNEEWQPLLSSLKGRKTLLHHITWLNIPLSFCMTSLFITNIQKKIKKKEANKNKLFFLCQPYLVTEV